MTEGQRRHEHERRTRADRAERDTRALRRRGELDRSGRHAGPAIGEISPTQAPQAFYNLGAVLTNRGRAKEASEAFKKAIDLKPDMSQAYLQLGLSLFSTPATMGDAVPVLEKFMSMPGISATDKDTATQLIAAAKAAGGGNASYKSEAAIAKEKADAEKAQKDAAKAKQKKP